MFNKFISMTEANIMGHVIAVAGKGGVGKTTLCGLMIQYLCEKGKTPVLAVDADSNSNLNEVLGVIPQDETVYRYDCDGRPLVELPGDSPVKKALYEILEGMGW